MYGVILVIEVKTGKVIYVIAAYSGLEAWLHSFLILALGEGERLTLRLGRVSLGKGPRYRLNRRVGGPQSGLDDVEGIKSLVPVGIRTPLPSNRSLIVIPVFSTLLDMLVI
jgi:hypothetical protein